MTSNLDAIRRLGGLIQVAQTRGVKLVRIVEVDQANRYTARPIEFDSDGATQTVGTETLTAPNLAEPPDQTPQLPARTDAVAIDAEGRWVIFVRQADAALFPARIINSQGGAVYTIREQDISANGTFSDAPGATDLTGRNLAELSLGPAAAVATDTIVLVTTLKDTSSPPALQYVFDHPAYAKYLD